MNILNVSDDAFKAYGKVIKGLDVSDLLEGLKETPQPDEVIYVASDAKLEACSCAEKIAYSLFGGMPIQIGYCNGSNVLLNAVEYHRDSEVNVALTDLILILGKEQDIEEDSTYDTSKMEAFLVPAGTVVTDFRYKSYKILPGKPKLAGLPASYVKSDKEAETLEITLVDETIGAQLILSYTIYNERPVITRNARLVNTSNQELRIEKIASMQLDLTKHDYDVISIPAQLADNVPRRGEAPHRRRCPVCGAFQN